MNRLVAFIAITVITGALYAQKNFNLELLAQVQHPIESNDIWGYVDEDGVEYAVIGTLNDCRIYSLKDPTAPTLVEVIPGASSIWRDFKSYDNYIYQITQRGADGLRIIDMSAAPDVVTSQLYQEVLTIGNETTSLETCHNIYIDEEEGLAFLAGCNIGVGGVIILDIATNPIQPQFIGALDERYSHDVVVRGDTLFSSEINEGNLGIYDISDRANPVLISRTRTSSTFTHNAWYSDDGNYVFTTDERPNAYVDAYDIRDIESPLRIDQYRPVDHGNVIPHNTHYLDGYLVTSWYTEGVIVLDAHRPDNLVKVGQYDTYAPDRTGFEGNWGAYPYLPSGLILASDLAGGLFVFNPSYRRASYLEGEIIDAATGSQINGATITIQDSDNTSESSLANGIFKTGTAEEGNYTVIISHPDFESETINVTMSPGEVTEVTIRLTRLGSVFTIIGEVLDQDGAPIADAQVILESKTREEFVRTNDNGIYRALVIEEEYQIYVAAWGYKGKLVSRLVDDIILDPIVLDPGYEDDFFADLGWQVSGDSRRGSWTRVIPTGTFFNGTASNPPVDIEGDLNKYCYVTGNDASSVGADDVDDGETALISPPIDVSNNKNPIIELTPWFFNDGGDVPPDDTMKIYLVNGLRKTLTHTFARDPESAGDWLSPIQIHVDSIEKRAKSVQVEIVVTDRAGSGHLVEGGIDKFRMYEGPLPNYPDDQEEIEVVIAPNPNEGRFYVDAFTNADLVSLRVYDLTGKLVLVQTGPELEVDLPNLADGNYVIDLLFASGVSTQRLFQKL